VIACLVSLVVSIGMLRRVSQMEATLGSPLRTITIPLGDPETGAVCWKGQDGLLHFAPGKNKNDCFVAILDQTGEKPHWNVQPHTVCIAPDARSGINYGCPQVGFLEHN
jgi:hypothetical protein